MNWRDLFKIRPIKNIMTARRAKYLENKIDYMYYFSYELTLILIEIQILSELLK